MSEKDHIPIVSVGKDITQKEVKQQYYQPGKVYRINNGLLHKCTGYTPEGRPIIDTICFILQPDRQYQIIKNINAEGDVIPGLDFVNKIMSGEIQEIDPNVWNRIDDLCCNLCKDLQEIIREKSERNLMTIEEKNLVIKTIKIIEEKVNSVERQYYHEEGDHLVASEPRELAALDATALISNFLQYYKHYPEELFEDENIKGEG